MTPLLDDPPRDLSRRHREGLGDDPLRLVSAAPSTAPAALKIRRQAAPMAPPTAAASIACFAATFDS